MLLKVVPNLLSSFKMGDSRTNQQSKMKGNVAQSLLVLLIPFLSIGSRTSFLIDGPLAIGPKVSLHGDMPLVPVGTSEDRDHLVEGAGHGPSKNWGAAGMIR